ncbi:MAG: PhnD/SsuA/transferrin family substrate-binding protein [Proteobacteria bacterium]|nr:PhnD/SsuA/transferrin family substrate-binding protein [Pseudomonadota bacterium]
MYDLPELRPATDAWWAGVARALRREGLEDVPDRLTRKHYTETIWRRPDLLLSQTCGYDIVGEWRERLAYVATPCYAAPGCDGPLYCSLIVVPRGSPARVVEELRGARCTINGYTSHSGCNALKATFAPLARDGRFFRSVTVSGSHVMCLASMERGEADVAAIDCVTYALLVRYRPRLVENTRVVAQTVAAPVGPYVTRSGASDDRIARLRGGLGQAMHDPGLAVARTDLLLGGFEILPDEDYARIRQIETDAMRLGYRDFSPETVT